MGWTPVQQRDFIALDLGPALEKNGLQHIKLMILDDARVLLPYWAEQVLFYYPTGQNRYCFIALLGRTGIVLLRYWAEQVLFYCPTGWNRYCFITILGRTGIVLLHYWAEQVLY